MSKTNHTKAPSRACLTNRGRKVVIDSAKKKSTSPIRNRIWQCMHRSSIRTMSIEHFRLVRTCASWEKQGHRFCACADLRSTMCRELTARNCSPESADSLTLVVKKRPAQRPSRPDGGALATPRQVVHAKSCVTDCNLQLSKSFTTAIPFHARGLHKTLIVNAIVFAA
jgi:hypothetical protein